MNAITSRELDTMKEWQDAKLWEAQNNPSKDDVLYQKAEKSIGMAIENLYKAVDWLADAAFTVRGLPMEHKVVSLMDAIENFQIDLGAIKKKH